MGHKRRMLVAKGEAMNFREAYRTWWANALVKDTPRDYSADRRSRCKIGVSIETSCRMERPIVICQEKDTFGTWILQ